MPSASRPYLARSSLGSPCVTMLSGTPMRTRRTASRSPFSSSSSATAEPKPPARYASSTVTMSRRVRASASRSPASSGLTKRALTTVVAQQLGLADFEQLGRARDVRADAAAARVAHRRPAFVLDLRVEHVAHLA